MPAHLLTTPLVGREQELSELTRLVGLPPERETSGAAADTGPAPGGIVLLSGDAGVGKTRLLTELRERADAAGWRTVLGHCLDFGDSSLPYLPFTEVLGRLAQDDPALVADIASVRPAVRQLLPGQRLLFGGDQHDPEGVERSELFETVQTVFERLAQEGPLLLLLEDLHWADRSTRDLLGFLFLRRFTGRISVVASYRSDDLHRRHPLRTAAAQWSRVPGVHRLQLGPLSDGSVRMLAESLQGGRLSEPELRQIVRRAEGNAFFAEELVVASELDSAALPEDLASLLLVRVDQLGDTARAVVRAVAVAGRQVHHDLLAAVLELEPSVLDAGLRDAVDSNVLVPVGATYAFRHALMGEAVYDDLLPGERVRLHAAYAGALASNAAQGTAAELARHARAAHDMGTAFRASVDAGDDAMAVGGPEDAARHYQLALELAADPTGGAGRPSGGEGTGVHVEETELVTVTLRAAESLIAAGDPHRAVQLATDRLERLPAEAKTDRARLLMALANAAMVTDLAFDALELTTEALGLVGPEPTPLRAKLLSVHAHANGARQRVDEAARWAEEALELGRQLGLRRVELSAATTLARLNERSEDPAASRAAFQRIVDQARVDGDTATELRGLHLLGALHFEQGRIDEALGAYTVAWSRARELARPWAPYGFDARLMASLVAYVAGRWDESQQIADTSKEQPPGLPAASLASVSLAVAAGRGQTSTLDRMPAIRDWWRKDGFVAILSGAAAIDLHGDCGDLEAALAVHDDVVESVTSLWQVSGFLAQVRLGALVLGQLATHGVDRPAAERERLAGRGDELVAVGREVVSRAGERGRSLGPEGVAWVARAEAEHLRLRWVSGVRPPGEGELVAAWRRAVDAFTAFPHTFELARTRARLAAVLRATGATADARAEADLARQTAQALGAAPLLRELRGSGASATPRREEQPGALTPREHEILALVAQGRSNGEIARQLFISTKTVSVHVSNILAKLGAGGRTEAAALARSRGLLG